MADPAGRLKLDGALGTGEVPDGPGQVVIGRGEDGALVPLGVVTGLEDPHGAAIIVVLQDHGAAHVDPELLERTKAVGSRGRQDGTDCCFPQMSGGSTGVLETPARDETQSPAPMPNSRLLSRVTKRFRTANYVRAQTT